MPHAWAALAGSGRLPRGLWATWHWAWAQAMAAPVPTSPALQPVSCVSGKVLDCCSPSEADGPEAAAPARVRGMKTSGSCWCFAICWALFQASHIFQYNPHNNHAVWNYCLFMCVYVCLLRAIPAAYGGSQARSLIRTVAASLHHSHSNSGSKLCLWPMPQLTAMLDL